MATYTLAGTVQLSFDAIVGEQLTPVEAIGEFPWDNWNAAVIANSSDCVLGGYKATINVADAELSDMVFYVYNTGTETVALETIAGPVALTNFSSSAYEISAHKVGGVVTNGTFYLYGFYGGDLNPGINFGSFIVDINGSILSNEIQDGDSVFPIVDWSNAEFIPIYGFDVAHPYILLVTGAAEITIVDLAAGTTLGTVETQNDIGLLAYFDLEDNILYFNYDTGDDLYLQGFGFENDELMVFEDLPVEGFPSSVVCRDASGRFYIEIAPDLENNYLIRLDPSGSTYEVIELDEDIFNILRFGVAGDTLAGAV